MAVPCSFDESDATLSKPTDMSHDQCDPLSIKRIDHLGVPCVVSCWKLTKEELDEFQRTGRIWLAVLGITMPPVMVSGTKEDFIKPTE